MIEVDGSIGGGQVLRSSVALSALLEKPFRITNIRQNRPKPGLKAQHISAVQAVARLCDADVSGLVLGSKELTFVPKKIGARSIKVNIPTAGSVGLVLQALLPAAIFSGKRIDVRITGGGTSGKWAPPVLFMEDVLLGILSRFGVKADINIRKHGFYPKGGADVQVHVSPSKINEIELIDRGGLVGTHGICVASNHLRRARVAERIKLSVMKQFDDIKMKAEYVNSLSPGAFVLLYAEFENSIIGADMIGERGVPSETVGKNAVELLKSRMNHVIDEHIADTIIPFLCIAGGKIKIPGETEHIKTNIETCRKFNVDIKKEDDLVWTEKM